MQFRLLDRTRRWAAFAGIGAVVLGIAIVGYAVTRNHGEGESAAPSEISSRARNAYRLTDAQWSTLAVERVTTQVFRAEQVTEGKIAVDEDRSTLIYSPYSGRVTKLMAKPGEIVAPGQALFMVEATDMVEAQKDFISAVSELNKAKSALDLAEIIERQNRRLAESKATSLRELQEAEAKASAARSDLRSATTALEATRNRLRILGKTDPEISKFEQTGLINPDTPIFTPIGGIVVQRKIGPGQYVNTGAQSAGASDTPFIVGDLSTVWLVAYVRETEASKVELGQPVSFKVLAYPDQAFEAKIDYIATALDPATRRLMVRAVIENPRRIFRPEMYASVSILTGEARETPAVPREAVIFEGNLARVWIVRDDKSIELRHIRPGLTAGRMIQVLDGLQAGDSVITKGALFVDRAAPGA